MNRLIAAFLLAAGLLCAQNLQVTGQVQQYTVGTLPTASANNGSVLWVKDSNSTTVGNTVATGGTNYVPVKSNGTNWLIISAGATGGGGGTLSGAVQGSTSATTLRDEKSVLDYGNGTTNSIASAISSCGAVACDILVPPAYAQTEAVPGAFWTNFGAASGPYGNPLTGATTASGVNVTDRRFGDWQVFNNPKGANNGGAAIVKNWIFNFSQGYGGSFNNYIPFSVIQNQYDGGTNDCPDTQVYCDKANYNPMVVQLFSWSPGQHSTNLFDQYAYSTGDAIGGNFYVKSFGGIPTGSDEGTEIADLQEYQGNVQYQGTVSGSPGTGATSVTISPTQGQGTQGADRWLINTTSGKALTAGTVSAINSPSNNITTMTGAGTSWPVSSAYGTITQTTAPGAATVTPTFTAGSIANITTSSRVCIAEKGNTPEIVIPTAVGGSTFTATFKTSHPGTVYFGVGGMCGYGIELVADRVTNSSFSPKVQQITGTLRRVWPIVYSSSATSIGVWVAGKGNWQGIPTQWKSGGTNTYAAYPSALINSVQSGGGVSNTLTLQANSVAWASGDTVECPLYPANQFSFGQIVLEKYQSTLGGAGGGTIYYYNGLWNQPDTLFAVANQTPVSNYWYNGGNYYPPTGFKIDGDVAWGLYLSQAPIEQAVYIGCSSRGCGTTNALFKNDNTAGSDYINYEGTAKQYSISTNSNAGQYKFGATALTVPGNIALTFPASSGTLCTTTTCAGGGGGGASTPATASLLKGNGTANGVVAATAGTDYVAPNSAATFSSVTTNGSGSGALTLTGGTSGSASVGVAAAAGTPSKMLLPTSDCTSGPCKLQAATASGGTMQTSWVADSGGGGGGTLNAPQRTVLTSGSNATYTKPANALYLTVELVGGGGGGGGSGTGPGSATSGGNTTFGTLTGNGGGNASSSYYPGQGGLASGGDVSTPGNAGTATINTYSTYSFGGPGGASFFGGLGAPTTSYPGGGGNAAANSGSGGGGASTGNTANSGPASGGGAGGYVKKLITRPSATYTYTVGAGGNGGAAGSGGSAGGNGGSGIIIVTAYFQ